MKIIKRNNAVSVIAIITLIIVTGFTASTTSCQKKEKNNEVKEKKYVINMFVTHGHCSTPFSGSVDNLKLELEEHPDLENPLEGMKISFEIDPNTFNVCASEELTQTIKIPGLFISKKNEKITFRTTAIYTMGIDWYQVNGMLSIKGVEREMKFFVTGIRNSSATRPTFLVLEGRVNLFDWDIDYNKIAGLDAQLDSSKWMHLNMRFDLK